PDPSQSCAFELLERLAEALTTFGGELESERVVAAQQRKSAPEKQFPFPKNVVVFEVVEVLDFGPAWGRLVANVEVTAHAQTERAPCEFAVDAGRASDHQLGGPEALPVHLCEHVRELVLAGVRVDDAGL